MEKVQIRFPSEDLERIEQEVETGKFPNRSEAIRNKVRKSYFLEAIVEMREATDGTDRDAALESSKGLERPTLRGLRAVLIDPSTLLSGLGWSGPPSQVLVTIANGNFELVLTDYILGELFEHL
jgi:Arc/MetJ-type ribon-helix-helix transcriptional regulator